MRWNEGEVALLASQTPDWEGKLTYKQPKSSRGGIVGSLWSGGGGGSSSSGSNSSETRERWFRLRANCLFYFRLNTGQGRPPLGSEPMGVLILENCHVQLEGFETPNAFAILFAGEPAERRHLFIAESERNAKQWETALKSASYQGLRDRLLNLQIKLREKTGCDPLLGTGFEQNPLFSSLMAKKQESILVEFAPPSGSGSGGSPPKPKPRSKAAGKSKSSFQSHVVCENWETHSPVNNQKNQDPSPEIQQKNSKPSFQSHVPVGNLLDL